MNVEYLTPLVPQFVYHPPIEGRCWQLVQPFVFKVDGHQFTVPAGFWTDFASVPRPIWPVISPYDLGVGPVPHDFGYFTGHANQAYWDLVLLACMEHDGISKFKRNAAYRAVQWFGGWAYESYRKRNQRCKLIEVMGRPRDWQIGCWSPRMTVISRSLPPLSVDQSAWLARLKQLTE